MATRKNIRKAVTTTASVTKTATATKAKRTPKAKEVNFDKLVEKHPATYAEKKAKDYITGAKPKTTPAKTFEKNLDKKNLKAKTKEAKDHKYKYSKAELGDADLMKKFRVKARKANATFLKRLEGAKPKEKKAIQAEYDIWMAATYS